MAKDSAAQAREVTTTAESLPFTEQLQESVTPGERRANLRQGHRAIMCTAQTALDG